MRRVLVLLCAAVLPLGCGPADLELHDDGRVSYSSQGEFESEPLDEGLGELQQGLVTCAERTVTAYQAGRPYPIVVVDADGRPAQKGTANAYAVMQREAARAGVHLRVVSGFRSQAEQQYFYSCYRSCSCNGCSVAARPGYSNHQSGEALDLNTRDPGVYRWLANNAARFGFRRTVSSEPWHWEYNGAHVPGGPCGAPGVATAAPSASSDGFRAIGRAPGGGYWLAKHDGGIFSFAAAFHGSAGALKLNAPVVGMAVTPSGNGYWIVTADGGVFTFGDAGYHGSLGGVALNRPVVGIAPTADGGGYWLVASDGGVFGFGNAGFHGSLGNVALNQPIVGMRATSNGGGYWLVAADGGIFAFGNAPYHGSTGGLHLNAPVVGMDAMADGSGYWLVAADGAVFSFGAAPFKGSLGNIALAQPVTGMVRTASGQGYWLVAKDGGVFAFGDAPYQGGAVQ